jgi:DNA-directed RNA polymerase specialized sigma24 family protein
MDRNTFDALYELYWAAVYRAALKRVADPGIASELTEEVFVQLWRNKHRTWAATEDVLVFLLKVLRGEIIKLMEQECITMVYPLTALVEKMPLPSAN